jgi:hypothetical protein
MSSLFNLATATAAGGHRNRSGYKIDCSVRLRASASAYFNRTMAPAGVTVYTFSAWVKRGTLGVINPIVQGYLNNNNYGHIIFKADNTIEWREVSVAANYGQVSTTAVFRDPSAWYHIVVVRNGTSLLIYVNGVSQTLTVSTTVNAAAGYLFGGSTVQRIGSDQVNSAFFDGYLTECYLIDGQALTPASFGETNSFTGVWQPKKYNGTYGTNGFYLNFSDNSAATATTIGKDYSGNGNNWTPNNISVTDGATYDSMLDVPTQFGDGGNGRGNYATLNPIDNNNGTLTNGNLNLSVPAGTSSSAFGNFVMTAGKWYWEVVPTNGSVFSSMIGVSDQSAAATNRTYTTTNGWAYYSNAQTYYNNTPASYGATFTTNDVIGVAYDADTGSLSFYKNGVSQGVAFSTNLFGKPIIPAFFNGTSSNAQTYVANFGQRPFTYTPPTGFKALNTQNLPTPTILKGNQYFDTILWSGNGVNGRAITANVGTVDFAWVKRRNGIDDNRLANSVTGGNKHLKSNTTEAEQTGTTVIQAFSGSTFTVGSDNSVNASGGTYVGWTWQKGATQGFDIVTFTNTASSASFNHNLGVTPAMIILKGRGPTTANWTVFHTSLANMTTAYLNLNNTNAVGTLGTAVPAPTSTTFGSSSAAIPASESSIAYLFSEVAGFSKFGSYTGNGSADGPFVFCGFRPAFVLVKQSSAAGNSWRLYDTARLNNEAKTPLYPNLSNAESVETNGVDCLSNGFKVRWSDGAVNTNGATYIFAAFAEAPFKNALAR